MFLDKDNETEFSIAGNRTAPLELRLSKQNRYIMVIVFGLVTSLSALGNAAVLGYILVKRLYSNFVSSHFIGHLMITNLISCCYLVPILVRDLGFETNFYGETEMLCRFHAFIMCTVWTVVYYMITCIAGVHLITFARIHYEQLFGLSPSIICGLAWLAGIALGLPCLTNSSVVEYQPAFAHCVFERGEATYRFLAYLILLGVALPISLTCYAYMRVLAIFYHAPIVFEALGLFRSRWLIFGFMINQLSQVPFYVMVLLPREISSYPVVYPVCIFLAYCVSLFSCFLYGPSLILMKEDDIALTHRAQQQPTGHSYRQSCIEDNQLRRNLISK